MASFLGGARARGDPGRRLLRRRPSRPAARSPVPSRCRPRRAPAPAGATARGPQLFAVPTKGGRGKPRIYFELYWQGARQLVKSFGPTSKKKPITSGLADVAMVPFYGFTMPEGFPLAESAGRGAYRLYLPPKSDLEKRRSDGRFVSPPPPATSRRTTAASACCSRAAMRSPSARAT